MNDATPAAGAENGGQPPDAIVEIGVATQALHSLTRFLQAVPADLPATFLVVAQDSRDESGDAITLDRVRSATTLPVEPAVDGMKLSPGTVVVAASGDVVTFSQQLLTVKRGGGAGMIDTLAVSLADAVTSCAILVVLGPFDSAGSLGTTAIKAAGGLTFAELQAEPPAAAGIADFVLPAADMPARIAAHLQHVRQLGLSDPAARLTEQLRPYLTTVAGILLQRTGHDFHGYKQRTFTRRLIRRMQVRQADEVDRYLGILRSEPDEVHALFQDLLIGVTQFFRDPPEFERIAKDVIPALVQTKSPGEKLRLWVLGCATGEEAYSLAILAMEHLGGLEGAPGLQIFATDIDSRALASARAGRFAETISQHMSAERLARWFTREGNTYAVNKELREVCVFSAHNILRDPPFSRIDLISCRNLLIYLNTELQSRVIPVFHFALQPGGCLFLGPAENVNRHTKLFEPIDRRHRIFRRQNVTTAPRPELPLQTRIRATPDLPQALQSRRAVDAELTVQAERVAARHAPAYVVVDEGYDVLHFSGRMGRYLEPLAGQASLNLMNLVHRELRLDLRALLHRAAATGEPATVEHLLVTTTAGRALVNLLVERMPSADGEPLRLIVMFQDAGPDPGGQTGDPSLYRDEHVRRLDTELQLTRDRLQSAIEELETTNEELKASNEEYQSVNEELQSTNEELETSKEELQSLNEELQTVNGELAHRVAELAHSNSDLRNVLESTQIAIVFLDNDLRVKNFTPAVTELFHLIESDHGRPITHITTRVQYPDLAEDVRRVLRTLNTVEREIGGAETERRFLVRVLPYRSVSNFIAGAVLTFLDITATYQAERALRESEERFRMITSTVPAFLFIASDTYQWDYVNPPFYSFTGMAEGAGLGEGWFAALHPEDIAEKRRLWQVAAASQSVLDYECRFRRADGSWSWFLLRAVPQLSAQGQIVHWFGSCTDINERRRAERRQRLLLAELQHRVKNILAVVRSVLTRTMESTTSLEDFSAHLSGRIGALSRTQGVLARTGDGAVMLDELVHEELAAHGGADDRQFAVEGPSLLLPDRIAETLGLAMHELATNALKYGALSVPSGRVQVRWRVYPMGLDDAGAKRLALEWQESGVPLTDLQPVRRGFGRELIEQGLPYELGATTALEFRPGGIRCMIELEIADSAAIRETFVLDPL